MDANSAGAREPEGQRRELHIVWEGTSGSTFYQLMQEAFQHIGNGNDGMMPTG